MSRKDRSEFLTSKEKEVKKLFKRLDILRKAQRNLGFVELQPPIRSGWERLFVLRSDLKHHKDYKTLQSILTKIQNTVVSQNKNFVIKTKRKKSKPIEQNLNHLTDKEYEKLEDKEKDYFCPRWTYSKIWKMSFRTWHITKPQFFEYKIQPHYITKVKLMDPDIEKEINFINSRLFGIEDLYGKYARHKPSNYKAYGKENKKLTLKKLQEQEIKEHL